MSFVMTEETIERLEAFENQVRNIGGVVSMVECMLWENCINEDIEDLKRSVYDISCLTALLRESIKTQENELNQITEELYRSQVKEGGLSA